ncbi:MAG: pyruvate ferredoxin oxidoreductase [Magnetococcales bacterium]|nr:pyruvate ferredoxin oxidoreductase [Magnetococcales bacterium]
MSTDNMGQKFPYPGTPGTGDGSEAVVYVETRASEGAAAYPITPSTNMAVYYQAQVANGFRNVWGSHLQWMELESEHSSASACEGYAMAGGRITNFTSGQGLILMKEVLYTISGKRLPMVMHVAARTLTSQGLCIHAGHDDVMGVADTGWGILFSHSVQAVCDLTMICRRVSEESMVPMMCVQDGFLLSHTIENLNFPEDDFIRSYLGDPREKMRSIFDPANPLQSGTVQNQDSYMSGKMAQRYYYDDLARIIQSAMDEFYTQTGRRYGLIEEHRMAHAEYAIVTMGTFSETAQSVFEELWGSRYGIKMGVVTVTSFRPFPAAQLVEAIRNCKAITVLERCDVPTMSDNPLTTEVQSALAKAMMGVPGFPVIERMPYVFTGVGGLGSRNVTPGQMLAIAGNMTKGTEGQRFFTVGIDFPNTLPVEREPDVRPEGSFSVRVHSVGGYGSVTTNKIIATMLGDIFGYRVQAAPKYGSEKKGLPTNSYLQVTPGSKILTHCDLLHVDFVPLMDPTTWFMGNPLVGFGETCALYGMKDGCIVFQHTDETTAEGLWESLPPYAKWFLKEKRMRLFGVDTIAIARECCQSDPSLIQRFQGVVLLGVFLRVTPFRENENMTEEELFEKVRAPLEKYFGKRGGKVVEDNLEAVRKGYNRVMMVTQEIMNATPPEILEQGKAEWDAKGKDVSAFII